jgi:sugar phosphate isomerase/epimerase
VIHLCESDLVPSPGKTLFNSVEYLLPYAKANQVTLSLENTWREDYLTAVWNAFPDEGLGFCFDSSHANLRGQFNLLKDHYDKLTDLHLSDNDGIKDRHWLPFDGVIDYQTLVSPYLAKTAIPYTMELISDREKYPDERGYLKEAKMRLDRLLSLEEVL